MWFRIKLNSSITLGAKHLFETILRVKQLRERSQLLVKEVIQRNAFFAHPENVLLAMVYDDDSATRKLGWEKMLSAKRATGVKNTRSKTKGQKKGRKIRQFLVPDVNFAAEKYYDIINWTKVTVPPLLGMLSEDDIERNMNGSKYHSSVSVLRMPCHSQAVERLVKVVTEASVAVVDDKARDGYIRNVFKSRMENPSFESKKDYI